MIISNVNRVPEGPKTDTVSDIQALLITIAKQHRVTVDELIKSAQSAGPDAPAYLSRALNLYNKMIRLNG